MFGNLWAAIAYEIRFRRWRDSRRRLGEWEDDGPESRAYFVFQHL